MFSRIFSRMVGRRCGSRGSTSSHGQRRPSRHLAAAAGQTIDALESRVLLSTIYVDASAPGPTFNGSSWTTAYKDLQLALSASKSGDEIRIADGTYKPTSTTSRSATFSLRDGVAIYGGYAGYGAADPDARDITLYPTVLSGDIGTVGSKSDNSYHVLTATGVRTLILDGITVTGGNGNGNSAGYGGGMYNHSSSPTLTNCTFIGNSAGTFGGAMYNYGLSSPTLTNCTFIGNSAGTSGGAVYNSGLSSPTLTNCTFSGNLANSGGGMYNHSQCSPTLTNCTFSGNSARYYGGSLQYGGGMYNAPWSSPTLTNCTFSGNLAGAFGDGRGGGVYNDSSSPLLTNCTFSGNSSGYRGGGIYNESSSPTLVNCTFSGNSSLYPGGGMYNHSSSPTLTNCILWGDANGAIYNYSATPVITYSNIQGGYAGVGNIDADPLFIRSPWTGPDGLFGTADDVPGDLRLRPESPALDIGSNAAVSGVSTDLAGNPRIQNGTVDLGACEGAAATPAPKIVHVDATATGANSGVSWADAFTSLQPALLVAGHADTIRIAGGVYRPTNTTDRTMGFALRDAVSIFGGYAGVGASNPDSRDIVLYPTVLSGDIGTLGSNADNSGHVLTATGVGPLTVLDGVIVTGGNSSRGGGLYAISASPTLINCTFSGNVAGDGGGMYNEYFSSPTLINCKFVGNSASLSGGGMCNTGSSSPMLINCTFSSNSIIMKNGYGGAMFNYSSPPTLINCILWGNTPSSPSQVGSMATYSDIEGGHAGTGNIDADPLFVRNPSPGPDNKWGTTDDDYGDLRLQPGSPCIDRGNNVATGLAGITTDLAGKPRFVDIALTPDAGVGTPPIVDMGAYEAQWACPAWLDPAGVGAWDAGDYSLNIDSDVLTVAADDANRNERLAAIRQAIALGRNTGAGIVSSTAGEDRGVIAALDAEGNILVRVALLGDVTLDDQIDGDDYFAMDMAFLAGGGLRPAADVNVDGVIDGRDYLVLDLRFLRSATGGVQQAAGIPVEQAAQQVPAGVFSVRSIAEELLMEEAAVLA